MKALVKAKKDIGLILTDVDMPEIQENDVLIKV